MEQFLQPSDISLVQYKRSTYRPSSQNQHSRLLSSSQQHANNKLNSSFTGEQQQQSQQNQALTTPRRANRILLKHTGQKDNDKSMEYYPQHNPPSILRTINRIFDRPAAAFKGQQIEQQRITRELRSLNNTFHSGLSGDTQKSDYISSAGQSQKKRRKDKRNQQSSTSVQIQDTEQQSAQHQKGSQQQQQSSKSYLNEELPQVSQFEQLPPQVNQNTASQVTIRASSVEIPDGKDDTDQRKRCVTQLSTQHPLNMSQLEGDTEGLDNNSSKRFRSEVSDPSEACFARCDINSLMNLDPARLKTLLSAELLNSKTIDIPTLINENIDYFRHLLGDCACSKCTCSRCKCNAARFKLTFKNGLSTNYSQAYQAGGINGSSGNSAQRRSQQQWHNQNTAVPQLTQSNYETLSALKHVQPNVDPSHTTVFKKDYTGQEGGGHLQKRHVEQYYKNAIPFIATSHYKSNFVDWKTQDPSYVFKRPQFSSAVPDCPMRLTTAYNSSYRDDLPKVSNVSASEIKRSQRHQAMENNYCDDKQTEYTKTYQGFNKREKISTSLPFKHLSETEKYYSQPSWKNQYKSVCMNDFISEQEHSPCPVEQRTKYNHQLLLSQQSQQSQVSGITQQYNQSNGQIGGIAQNSTSNTAAQANNSNNGYNSNSDIHSNRSATKRIIARSTVLPHRY